MNTRLRNERCYISKKNYRNYKMADYITRTRENKISHSNIHNNSVKKNGVFYSDGHVRPSNVVLETKLKHSYLTHDKTKQVLNRDRKIVNKNILKNVCIESKLLKSEIKESDKGDLTDSFMYNERYQMSNFQPIIQNNYENKNKNEKTYNSEIFGSERGGISSRNFKNVFGQN